MKQRLPLIIISGKNPLTAKSGYAMYAYNLAKIASELGYSVSLFCIGKKNSVTKTPIGTIHVVGSKLLKIPFLHETEMAGLPFLAIQLAKKIAGEIKTSDQAVLWGIGPWSLAGSICKIFLRGKKITLFADYFTSLTHEYKGTVSAFTKSEYSLQVKIKTVLTYLTVIPFYSLLERFLLKQSTQIITHYQSTEKILHSQYAIPFKKFKRLAYSVAKTKQKHRRVSHSDVPRILLVSRHDGRKGIPFLLHALAILEKKHLRYRAVLVGGGKLLSAHKNLAQKFRLKHVVFTGAVKNVVPFFRQADLFVFPSLEEGSSALAILEAMQQGVPIVSTHVDGIPEDIEDGISGLLVPPADSDALARAIEKLLKNQRLAQKLGRNAQKQYQKKYNRENVKKAVRMLLNDVSSPLVFQESK